MGETFSVPVSTTLKIGGKLSAEVNAHRLLLFCFKIKASGMHREQCEDRVHRSTALHFSLGYQETALNDHRRKKIKH